MLIDRYRSRLPAELEDQNDGENISAADLLGNADQVGAKAALVTAAALG
jgi:hypothetical protein